jgi:hypothetical protein
MYRGTVHTDIPLEPEAVGIKMSMYQIIGLYVVAGFAVVCLFAIFRSLEKLAKAVSSIGLELTKMNSKLEVIEAVNRDDLEKGADQKLPELEAIESAISNFEKLKRVDLSEQQEAKL